MGGQKDCWQEVDWAGMGIPSLLGQFLVAWSELGNARRLLRKFDLKDLTKQKSRRDKSAWDSSSED